TRACSVPSESEQALAFSTWRMFLSANRRPPRIKSGAGFRRNMRSRAFVVMAISVERGIAHPIAAAVAFEHFGDLRMADRFVGRIGQEILLRDIRDVFGFRVLGEPVRDRLVLWGPTL